MTGAVVLHDIAFAMLNLPWFEKIDGQSLEIASTNHSMAPLERFRVLLVAAGPVRTTIAGVAPSTPAQIRKPFVPAVPVHDNVTGEVAVVPFCGATSVIAPTGHCGWATVNRETADLSEVQVAKSACTYQSIVPGGMMRVMLLSEEFAVWSNAAPLEDVKSL